MSLKLFINALSVGRKSSKLHLSSRSLTLKKSANFSSQSTPSEKLKLTTNFTVKNLLNADPKSDHLVCTEGWVRSIRSMKQKTFLHLNDGSCFEDIQVVIPSHLYPQNATFGSCIKVQGKLQDSKAPGQKLELQATEVIVIGGCDNETYPIKARQHHSMDYLRSFPHLRVRTRTFSSLSRIRSAASYSVHQFFQERGFEHIHTPILTSNDCEGGGEVFVVQPMHNQEKDENNKNNNQFDNNNNNNNTNNINNTTNDKNDGGFFGKPVYLTVSGQLHLEVMTGCHNQVYTIGPTFRAENNQSRHHLCEFTMIEAEVANSAVSMGDLTMLIEQLIKHMTSHVMTKCPRDVEYFCRDEPQRLDFIDKLINSEYTTVTYDEVIDILAKSKKDFGCQIVWGTDLNKEMEKYLSDHHFNFYPFFIINFPAKYINKDKTKPFYSRLNDDGKTGASCDLLLGGVGEVCGGGLREERFDMLKNNIINMNKKNNNNNNDNNSNNEDKNNNNNNNNNENNNLINNKNSISNTYPTTPITTHPPIDLEWYMDLRRYGGRRSGGFGLGFERYIQALLGLQSIKDVVLFPRSAKLCRL